MKIITAAQLETIRKANDSVKGTSKYNKYYMPYQFKTTGGKWTGGIWYVPQVNHDCIVKTFKGKKYIMINPETRYEMTEAVLELLGEK